MPRGKPKHEQVEGKEPVAKKEKKPAEPLTLEKRVELIENSMRFLARKLRTHGIHLATDRTEPEPKGEEDAE